MTLFLFLPFAVPLLAAGFLTLETFNEKIVGRLAFGTVIFMAVQTVVLNILWLEHYTLQTSVPLFVFGTQSFGIKFFLDFASLVFLNMTVFLGLLVVYFSRYYLHRETGYTRFFSALLLFLSGMSELSLAADMTSFFLGWEIIGIASYLLIGFYQHRSQPVHNAQKIYSIYRFCDVGLLVSVYLFYTLFGDIHFNELANLTLTPSPVLLFLALAILLSALGKSAQFPFSFWLARAMEGPTPSSAIFYGALSVHAGVLLLYRTLPIWQASSVMPWLIGSLGLITAFITTLIARAQSNIKGQIAYASIAQVGFMFVELALGWPTLALFHFVSNAFFRCYQLLISPSVVVFLLKMQRIALPTPLRFSFKSLEDILPKRLKSTFYTFAFSEAYLEHLVHTLFWKTPKNLAFWIQQIPWFFYVILPAGILLISHSLLIFFATLALLCSLASLNFKNQPQYVWRLTTVASLCLGLSIAAGSPESTTELIPYVSTLIACFVVGSLAIQSHAKKMGFLSLLGLTGFPISPVFFMEELLLHSAFHLSFILVGAFIGVFVINGISLVRTYSQFFLLGAHHETLA